MAQKANSKTGNKMLIWDILDDQAGLMLPHLSPYKRFPRLKHNLKELMKRLGEDFTDDEITKLIYS